jgi:serpin B
MRQIGPIRMCLLAELLILLCAGPAARGQTNDTAALVSGNTAFAFDLYSHLSATPGNLFFSPYSISTALAMTYAGARGQTETQMRPVLHFDDAGQQVHSSFAKLQIKLNGAAKQGNVELGIANALWADDREPFLPAFLTTVSDNYKSDLNGANFRTGAEDARGQINGWVAKMTRDRIQEIIPPGVLNYQTKLVLVNAIYFKGAWDAEFNADETSVQPFHLALDKQVDARFMRQIANVYCGAYEEFGGFEVAELPYSGNQLSMVILMPRHIDGLDQFEIQINLGLLDAALGQIKKRHIRIELPKFRMESEFLLNRTLAGMGMTDSFNRGKADFSGMNGKKNDLYISDVFHKAWVEVNEKGTEAAASTAVVMGARGARPIQPEVFRVDHPFIFLIRERTSGTILFVGRVANPVAS